MGLFNKQKNNGTPLSKATRRFNTALTSAIGISIFTVINIIFSLVDEGSYFLWSLYFPYSFFNPEDIFATTLAIITFGVFVAFIFLAKKNPKFIIGLTVLSILDFLYLLLIIMALLNDGYPSDEIMSDLFLDIIFHIWIVVEMILACTSMKEYIREQGIENIDETQNNMNPFAGTPYTNGQNYPQQSDPYSQTNNPPQNGYYNANPFNAPDQNNNPFDKP